MRIRDLVVLVVFVDEVQQDRAALKQPDGLVAELVRDGRDLRARLAGARDGLHHDEFVTYPAVGVDL